jgi:RNA polymerase sigma factor (sigma-70 family)
MAAPTLALLRTQSDARLVALARDGHERAFEAIVERYRRELLRHGQRVLGEARAEDVLQHSLLAAWTALRRGDDVRDLRPWLHRIVHNTALNALRGGRDDFAELRESMQVGGAPEEEIERRVIVRDTLAALAKLPERQREALLRVAVQGRSQEEVAEDFGLSHGAVRQLVHRARTTLRAAATAVTPLPVASWLASFGARSEPVSARIAELASDTGSAGLASALAKAGAVAVLAGGAAAGPAIVDRSGTRDTARAADVPAHVREASSARTSSPPPASSPVIPAAAAPDSDRDDEGSSGSRRHGSGNSSHRSRHRGSGSSRRGSDDDDDRSGPGPSGSGDDDHSGSGSGDSDSSRSGSGDDSSHSGPGGGDDSSGHGGSGTSGSASSGKGSSGSGSSGSGSSGSGSSGSGSGEEQLLVPIESDSSGSGSSGSDSSGSGSSGSDSSGSGSGSGSD